MLDRALASRWHEKKLGILTELQAASGRKIIIDKAWEPPHFGSVSLADGHWEHVDDKPRTLGWQLHQFAFMPALIAYDRHNETMEGSELALTLVDQWWSKFRDTPMVRTNMAWHDHGTALRLSNFLLLRSHLGGPRNPLLDDICRQHASLLKQEDFYERGNNHGFDQSIILFEYSQEMADGEAEQLARERINFEISAAFAPDGGHVENSPGYHHFGIAQVKLANEIGLSYTGEEMATAGLVERAEMILAHMTRPDRKPPHIGDTSDFTVRRLPPPSSNDLVLPDSGWAFFRSGWDTQALQGVFKSGYRSIAHRHDDDLALSLFALGEEWIIDGGMFAHEPKDPMRVYMRSAHSHSLPYVVGLKAVRDMAAIGQHSRIVSSRSSKTTFEVTGETKMWQGFDARRTVVFDRLKRTVTIKDQIEPVSDEARERASSRVDKDYAVYATRFLIPGDKQVSRTPNGVQIKGQSATLHIESSVRCKIVSGQSAPTLAGWRSTKPNEVMPAFDVSFLVSAHSMEETFTLCWV
ncbi:heparinase II/III domain-containing protein [Sinorhizobium fredii]|uniref:heparinase II/III domain-containing protein n=1 Tax=Rhizobium fredii TaxID=380 RepID=UPI0004BA7592|nr:heparinase II/III family protein [Sinorhizobium fredii]